MRTAATNDTSARWPTHGLPAELTSFVGRRREVADVKRLLSRSRLVTLTGPGGVGKTRLARRVATDLRLAFPSGVWLVELAELENPALLAGAICEVVGIEDQTPRPALDALIDHLRDRTALIVLDNCEHLLHDCALLADTLLRQAACVRILATSRQVLGIAGEQTLAVPVLSLPSAGPVSGAGWLSTESFVQYDAVRLFAERAQAVLPDFAVTAANRDAVERICRRLDGIPLAIELAATQLRMLSVQQLLDRLDDRFRLLDGGSRAVLPRHRTLRALVDWSYGLCTREERLLWARASVFCGGMDLEAAEAICSGEEIAREDVFGLVAGLVDKSVLMRDEHALGIRYRLMETMRQYGRDRLAEYGEEAELRRRHRHFYQRLSAESRARLFGPGQVRLLTRLRLENANLRSALDSSLDCPEESQDRLRMAGDLLYHWLTGYLREGRQRLQECLAADPDPGRVRARALVAAGWLAIIQGEIGAAVEMLGEAHRIGTRLGDARILADVTLHRGLIALDQGDIGAAVALCTEALAGHGRTADLTGLMRAHQWLTAARIEQGDLQEAVTVGETGIALCDAHEESLFRAYMLTMLGIALWRRGNARRASRLAKESLSFHRSIANPRGIAMNLSLLVWTNASEGRYEKAGRLLGVLKTFSQPSHARQAIGVPVSGYRHLTHYQDECEAKIRRAIGATDLDAAVNLGSRLAVDEALAYALREDDVDKAACDGRASLTQREDEVARLVAQGMSNKQIAAELVISQRTVEAHVKHILGKLAVKSRTQIAIWVEEQEAGGDPPCVLPP